MAVVQGHAGSVGIDACYGAVLDQLLTGLPGCAGPVGDHLVAAHGTGGRFEQSRELRLGLQRETRSDGIGIKGFVGNALIVHHPAGAGD